MDPFVTLQYGIKKFKSNIIKNGGLKPEWNQIFQIPVDPSIEKIELRCCDKDFITNDIVGMSEIMIADLLNPGDLLSYHPYESTIYYKNKESG